MPQRKYKEQVLCRDDRVPRRGQRLGHHVGFELLLGAQHWEVQLPEFNPCDLMSRRSCAFGIRIGKRVAEPLAAGIRMTLNNHHSFGHYCFCGSAVAR